MSYTYLLESGEVSSAECFSDIPQYVLSKLNLIAGKFYCNGRWMASCPPSRSGTILKHSTGSLGVGLQSVSAEASHARTYPWPVVPERVSKEKRADYGKKCFGWFAKFIQDTSSWKIAQQSLFVALPE